MYAYAFEEIYMETSLQKNILKDQIILEFESSKHSLFGDLSIRKKAIESFSKQGIPNRKQEEYKYLNIEAVLKEEFAITINKTLTCEQIDHLKILKGAYVVVIENGLFIEGLSKLKDLQKGLTICSLAQAAKTHSAAFEKHYSKYADIESDIFIGLNTAIAKDGAFIHIAMNTVVEKPIHIIHISTSNRNSIIHPRHLIVVEKNVQSLIVESFETVDSNAKTFNNAFSEIVVGENSIVDYYKIQDENKLGYLLNTTQITLKHQSIFSTHTFTLSGMLVRNNLNLVLDDEGIESHLLGLYLTTDNQVVDNHTTVDHRKPKCNSNELYKGIIDGKSTATFNGKIFVRKDAQKTNAFQSNKNILLSDDGTINTKPQLEIYADDVKCSHGTSTGKLDEEKIFYLRARGLSEDSAKKLLMHAFASEIVNTIKNEDLREYIEHKISTRFI